MSAGSARFLTADDLRGRDHHAGPPGAARGGPGGDPPRSRGGRGDRRRGAGGPDGGAGAEEGRCVGLRPRGSGPRRRPDARSSDRRRPRRRGGRAVGRPRPGRASWRLPRGSASRPFPPTTKARPSCRSPACDSPGPPTRRTRPISWRVKRLLECLAKTVPLDAPLDRRACPRVGRQDRRRLAGEEHARRRDEAGLRDQHLDRTGLASRISLLYYLFIIRSAGGLRALETDAQERRFVGGPQSLSKAMAAPMADHLVLGSPVHRVPDDPKSRIGVESKRLEGRGAASGGRDDARGHATDRLRARIAAGTSRARGSLAGPAGDQGERRL